MIAIFQLFYSVYVIAVRLSLILQSTKGKKKTKKATLTIEKDILAIHEDNGIDEFDDYLWHLSRTLTRIYAFQPFKRILFKHLAPYIMQMILGKHKEDNLTLLYVIAYLC